MGQYGFSRSFQRVTQTEKISLESQLHGTYQSHQLQYAIEGHNSIDNKRVDKDRVVPPLEQWN